MQTAYIALLVLVGASVLLQLQWLFLLSAALFLVLLVSESVSSVRSESPAEISYAEADAQPAAASAMQPPQQQPIVVVTSPGVSISDMYFANLLANVSSADVLEKSGPASPYQFLSRGSHLRQNFFGHEGKWGAKHQAMRRDVTDKRMSDLTKRMDKLIAKMGA